MLKTKAKKIGVWLLEIIAASFLFIAILFSIAAGASIFLGIPLGLVAGYFGAVAAFWLADKKILDNWMK